VVRYVDLPVHRHADAPGVAQASDALPGPRLPEAELGAG
jgi:hypothetical protein